MAKIIVADKMESTGIEYLKSRGFEVDTPFGISREELLEVIEKYDAIIVRSATKVTKEVIERGVNLKVAGRAGNGIDNIDVDACTRRGIAVVNTPEGNIMAAAEMGVAMAFSYSGIYLRHTGGKNKTSEEISLSVKSWRARLPVLSASVKLVPLWQENCRVLE